MNRRSSVLFATPLAHETCQWVGSCNCSRCSTLREERKAAQWLEQALQEGDLFDTQLNFKFTRTPEGHEILTRQAARRVPASVATSIPGGIDLAALLRGVTRPDKGTGSLPSTISALAHSIDPDVQKSHALRRTPGTSLAAALSAIRNHLAVLHTNALRAGRAGRFPAMFEWVGEGMHLIQDSYSQAHTQRDNIGAIGAHHAIRKVRFFGFINRFPPRLSQAPNEHQVIKGTRVGDPRDRIHDPATGALKPEGEIAIRASLDYLLMVLRQVRRPPSPSDVAELRAFMNWHLSSSPVPFSPLGPGPTPGTVSRPTPSHPLLRRGSCD